MAIYTAIKERIPQEISEAGPALFAPAAVKNQIPVPIIELIVTKRITLKLNTPFISRSCG